MKRSLIIAGVAAAVVSAAIIYSGNAADKESKNDGGLKSSKSEAKFNKKVKIGDKGPDFKDLEGVDGKRHGLADYKDADVVVVTFTCNHCPVAIAYEDRFIKFQADYKDKKVQFVAINCNNVPEDRLDKMKERAEEKDFNFAYLYDPSQASGKAYGATVTPHLFVLDKERKIAYMGAFDDSMEEDAVKKHYLTDAVDAVLAGTPVQVAETLQKGCGIAYE